MKLRVAIIAVALLAIGGAVVARSGKKASPPGATSASTSTVVQPAAPQGAIRISIAFSPEKEDILRALIAQFDREKHTVNGKPIYVIPDKESSGAAEAAIVKGTLKPTIWSPAGSLWGGLVNYELDQ